MRSRRRSNVIGWGAALGAAIVALACFSERQSATAPGGALGACNLAIAPPIIGKTQALVALRNYSFNPETLHVAAGSTVTWVNCEPSNVDPHTSHARGDEWTSGYLSPGMTYSWKFSDVGLYEYFCEPHPFMHGVVIVE
jgi:plastocyanin